MKKWAGISPAEERGLANKRETEGGGGGLGWLQMFEPKRSLKH
jgi:hypothetical protein